MKRMVFWGVVIALVACSMPAAAADPPRQASVSAVELGHAQSPIVRWDRIEGTIVMPDGTGMQIGPFQGSARYRVGGAGKVDLLLHNGMLHVRVEGLSWGLHYNNSPLGAGVPGPVMATVLCDSTERFAPASWADTPPFELDEGNGWFTGKLDLPPECSERPEEIVFLLRHAQEGPRYGAVIAYGAGRTIR